MDKKSTTKTTKRPPSPYINFTKVERKVIIKENPKMTFSEIGKELGTRWRSLSSAEQLKFKK